MVIRVAKLAASYECAPANMSGINEMTAAAACSAGSRRVKAPT